MQAVKVSQYGGPEAMDLVEVDDLVPGPGQMLVRTLAAGVNFIDLHQRAGRYPTPLPFVPGLEGAGEVLEVGSAVDEFKVGERVAWKLAKGSYAEQVLVEAWQAVPIPNAISEETAAAVMLQGSTAHFLVSSAYAVQPGETILIHAAAGGVGHLLTQIAKLRGARVIGTVSTAEKEKVAREAGADEVIRYDGDVNIATSVRDLTGGEGVAAVYDGVGKTTFDASLASLRPRGYLVVFGGASGPVENLDVERLNSAGSVFLTRPTLGFYTRTREEVRSRADDLFQWLNDGRLVVRVGGRFPLTEAGMAHEALESRGTTGKLILLCRASQ
jgi:NADPH:quinone reductase